MFPWKIFTRIVLIQAIVAFCALLAVGLAGRYYFEEQVIHQSENQLKSTLIALSAHITNLQDKAACDSSPHLRLTIIAGDGLVLCDSQHDSSIMENHASRPEVQAAELYEFGFHVRKSETLQIRFVYGAMKNKSGNWFIRGAVPLEDLDQSLKNFDTSFGFFLFAVLLTVLLFSVMSGRALVLPIGELYGRLNKILSGKEKKGQDLFTNFYGEWTEIESALEKVGQNVDEQNEILAKEREVNGQILANIGEGILAIDKNSKAIFWNKKLCELFENLSILFSHTQSENLWTLIRVPEVYEAFKLALNGKEKIIFFAYGEKSISLSVTPLTNKDKNVYGAVGIFFDITQIKAAEQIRVDFVANVSHELKTPLTAIKGFSETLLEDLRANKTTDVAFAEAIYRNAERLMALVRDLLDLSGLESGDSLEKSFVDAEEITHRAILALKAAIEQKTQTVIAKFEEKSIYVDSHRIEQVLINLLDNANKYCPENTEIQIEWKSDLKNVQLIVKDNGPGIDPIHLPRLFERFYRADQARSRELGGTGLGLAIAKHIILRHGGSIKVESTPDKGTSFICELPKVSKESF
ncbi:MAG: hypothetical protein A2504_04620 [Bdellovibrionales bacterium RIFOXYD12_FULL_39_22]|nr:MAG: hypothetical protein A2385_07205 [Bdellovibrionales bacterium RIFOXYB1_FULL_39_21]OFZ42049.1 MAG: hypothetical protein A2485_09175 [Bdellovibrionales bacterium RIFOXYC12_FULL_39_17]OFZ50765.1 MAG: hypothetical protein A2404_06125 [Bdellovibrionales bacterium RIFOXYC1_FULL_39_130]OFZ73503.1 MAG: hypothetical protein A2451_04780 [Bdellovibrionales bacterium RIFOXYC2_FULL_39_8]OFZ77988.1 MAG: hypothetical protein A2560_01295 [Bdellovibrionales bacterium RIFOXYD1_FULL_39_84]OFZ93576.1 MAG: